MASNGLTRTQRKKLEAARRVVGSDDITVYGSGTGHARVTKGVIGLAIGVMALVVVLLVVVHVLVVPGFVFLAVGVALVRPRRGVALTPAAVLVFHESAWNARPNRVIVSTPPASFRPTDPGADGALRLPPGSFQPTDPGADGALRLPPGSFQPTDRGAAGGSRVSLQLGPERVTLKRREYQRMLAVHTQPPIPPLAR